MMERSKQIRPSNQVDFAPAGIEDGAPSVSDDALASPGQPADSAALLSALVQGGGINGGAGAITAPCLIAPPELIRAISKQSASAMDRLGHLGSNGKVFGNKEAADRALALSAMLWEIADGPSLELLRLASFFNNESLLGFYGKLSQSCERFIFKNVLRSLAFLRGELDARFARDGFDKVNAYLSAWIKVFNDKYINPTDHFVVANDAMRSLLDRVVEAGGPINPERLDVWRRAFFETNALLSDVRDALNSAHRELVRLCGVEPGRAFSKALKRLPHRGIETLGGCVEMIVGLNLCRAEARKITMSVSRIAATELPEGMRADVFRAINRLVMVAIRSVNTARSQRWVKIAELSDNSLIRITVADNGIVVDGTRDEFEWRRRGFTDVRRLVHKHDGTLRIINYGGEGTVTVLSMDIGGAPTEPQQGEGGGSEDPAQPLADVSGESALHINAMPMGAAMAFGTPVR